ncbi:MAG: hypothetical protein LBL26_10230 [Peptococcaceae bacterium]|jgi:hypothetical protein|nr:hypothetical protein [Peptococcaceae bacterium]
MLTLQKMAEMSHMEIENMDTNTLIDIGCVRIDDTLPAKQRISNFLEQIKNPYCYRCGKTPVKIEYISDAKPLDEKILDYFIGLKNR